MVERMDRGVRENLGATLDPWVYRGLLLAVEGLVIESGEPFTRDARDRVRRVAGPMFLAVLASAPHMPTQQ